MRHHGLKMAEINKIIKEYWINTYKGNGKVAYSRLAYRYEVTHIDICLIGGLQPISRDTDNNAAMYNCWWMNKRS